MSKEYNYLIFIGRFQPFHAGHSLIINEALNKADNVIVLIGSSNVSRSFYNPFTFEERAAMIMGSYSEEAQKRLIIAPIKDVYNQQLWIKETQKIVQSTVLNHVNREHPNVWISGTNDVKIGLIGHNKDNTSYYLKLFPDWGNVDVPQSIMYNATDIRKEYFTNKPNIPIPPTVSKHVKSFLVDFTWTETFETIRKEHEYIENYKEAWSHAPYEPIFVTTDAVVVQSGHVLVVKRRSFPGQGLMALPGGFLNPDEWIEDGMIRELREETRIKVPDPVLRGNIKKKKVFDHPYRSLRGRTITNAFLIELPPQKELPKIKAGSDAAKATWIPLADLKSEEMFEDHYFIIQDMIGEL